MSNEKMIIKAYEIAKEVYASYGVDVDKVTLYLYQFLVGRVMIL